MSFSHCDAGLSRHDLLLVKTATAIGLHQDFQICTHTYPFSVVLCSSLNNIVVVLRNCVVVES